MALGAVLATALTDRARRSKGLYLGGVDVASERGAVGNRVGVPIESVSVTEAGPGGVSSMTFSVDDPGLGVGIARGMDVRFHDHVTDAPDFLGFVQGYTVAPAFGDQGRHIDVQAIGIEAVLDWAMTTSDLTFPGGSITRVATAIQTIVANSAGLGPIRAFANDAFSNGTQASPLSSIVTTPNAASFSIPTGTTVREAIRTVIANMPLPGPDTDYQLAVTVDFTYGLRTWRDVILSALDVTPSDYGTETIVNGPAGTVSENLEYTVSALDAPVAVVVRGSALSVTVPGGEGVMGPVASITDTTITTIADAWQRGQAYLASFRQSLRGSYRQTDRVPNATIHPGSIVVLTDARVGLAAVPLRVAQIDKEFNPSGREDWTLSFGGMPPSGAALIRRLTRATLS